MKQLGLTVARWMKRRKKIRKERFLEEIDAIVPWQLLIDCIEPHYPKSGKGRPRIPLERMLRIHLLQHFFSYSDPEMEKALYEAPLYCRFFWLNLAKDTVPDETTLCHFWHLLKRGTVFDATLIAAPPSTKNRSKRRDPEMSSTCMNNQWYIGMKAHIGDDVDSGLVRSVVGITAKVPDNQVLDSCCTERSARYTAARPTRARSATPPLTSGTMEASSRVCPTNSSQGNPPAGLTAEHQPETGRAQGRGRTPVPDPQAAV